MEKPVKKRKGEGDLPGRAIRNREGEAPAEPRCCHHGSAGALLSLVFCNLVFAMNVLLLLHKMFRIDAMFNLTHQTYLPGFSSIFFNASASSSGVSHLAMSLPLGSKSQ
jgi:hypothetical protein